MSAAFSFGSFGDITTILQLAWGLRNSLEEARDAAQQIPELIADIDGFTTVVMQVRVAVERRTEADDLRNAVMPSLQKCLVVLRSVRERIEKERRKFGRLGDPAWKAHWKKLAWSFLGGKEEVKKVGTQLEKEVATSQALLSASQW